MQKKNNSRVRHPEGGKNMSNVLSVRIDDPTQKMLEAMETQIVTAEGDTTAKPKRAEIISQCIKEHYARSIENKTADAYSDIIAARIRETLDPYIKQVIEFVQKIMEQSESMDEDLKAERLMTRMCFNLLFRSDELPEDAKLLRRVLEKHTVFDDVLEEAATGKIKYNSVIMERDPHEPVFSFKDLE
jgi:prophage DNA circulation protein